MINLFIFVSTLCSTVNMYPIQNSTGTNVKVSTSVWVFPYECIEYIRISTVNDRRDGEDLHYLCDFVGHRWEEDKAWLYLNGNTDIPYAMEDCSYCGKRRKKVERTTAEYIELP